MSRFGWFFVLIAVIVTAVPFAAAKSVGDSSVTLSVMLDGEIREMDIEEYALRVLAAVGQSCENPEAQKALAVAARSCGMYFALYGMKHEEFEVCSDKSCCLPLRDPKSIEGADLSALSAAVRETKGIILTLDKLPAMALFTLCASRGTRYCEEFTYLSPIENPDKCDKHITVCEFSADEFSHLFPNADASSCVTVYGENEKCEFFVIGGKMVSADAAVSALSLPSYEFELTLDEEKASFTCFGAGHGIGLDLCGADKLASNGHGYEKILLFYYPNLEINKIYNA